MTASKWIIEIALLLLCCKDCWGLKNVKLTIEPPVVVRYQNAILTCTYDLEDAPLYSVQWYRGAFEFYRCSAAKHSNTKTFPISGLTVDLDHSNCTQAYLRNISDFKLSGNFSCEVTTDENTVSTGSDTQSMLIVQLPESPPTISVGHEPLDYGHTLQANCSSPPSKPQALLKITLNNQTISRTDITTLKKTSEPTWSDLTVTLTLAEFHFKEGRLILGCVAQVAHYTKKAELELVSARHPVPERVSAVDSASSLSTYAVIQIITFNWLFLINS